MKNIYLSFICIVFLSSLGSAAVLCDYASIQQSWVQGNSPTLTLTCTNGANSTVTINKAGSYYSLNPNLPFTFSSASQQQVFTITFDPNAPTGNHQGVIYFNDNSQAIPVNLTVTGGQQQGGCQINPSLVSFSQTVQQGASFSIPKITFDPIGCSGNLLLTPSSVSIQGGIITTQGQKPVYIQSVVQDGVFLNVDTTGLNTQQTYTSYLNINAFNKQFQVPITITVTAGTSPGSNFSISQLPTCTLTSTILSLNSTYSLVCTGIQPDVSVTPEVDTNYLIGTGLDTSLTQIIWYFKPVNFGTTLVKANFKYRGYPVGNPYSQSVQVTTSGGGTVGTNLSFIFTPDLSRAKNGEPVIIQIMDSFTGSLITGNPQLLIDSIPQISTNGYSFTFNFSADTDYNLRGLAVGYADLVRTVRLSSKPLNISMNPQSGDSQTRFNITTPEVNASLFINGNKVSNPYLGTLQQGEVIIKAIQEGYLDAEINITIEAGLTVTALSSEFKEGVVNIFTLTKNDSWGVFYKESLSSESAQLLNGTGSQISFTPNKKGIYEIRSSSGTTLWSYEIRKKSLHWIWWVVIGAVIFLVVIIYFKSKNSSSSLPYGQFGGTINTG